MKRQIAMGFVFLMGILLTATDASAQASNKTQRQLLINSKGEINDDRGTRLGYISKEDIAYDNAGKKLYFIQNGKVYDAEGKPLGKAKKMGGTIIIKVQTY